MICPPGAAPVAFTTSDGKSGWVRRLSNEALSTPAYAKGRIFTGGGYSSHIFMTLDARTGKTLWAMPTQDNGPTAPVVQENIVAYNMERCHTEVRDADDGDLVWSEVTGGTLLTQPVIADELLFIPHPTMARHSNASDDRFRMLGVNLKNHRHTWDADMTADVLSAPVAAAGRVFFSCTDGRVFCLKTGNGGSDWHVVANATSVPVVVGNVLAITTAQKSGCGTIVGIRRYDIAEGELQDQTPLAPTRVEGAAPTTNLAAGWDYQGPKLAAAGKRLFNAPGNTLNAVDLETGKIAWRAVVSGHRLGNQANTLTPPALGKERLYLDTAEGHLLALSQRDGSLACAYKLSEPVVSQLVLADGALYFATGKGQLVCLKLKDPDAADWHAWGGNAQHNKVD